MRILSIIGLLLLPILAAGEALDANIVDEGEVAGRRLHHPVPTIETWIASRGAFTTLVKLLGLVGLAPNGPLNGNDRFTLFAPTNKAFESTFATYPGVDALLTSAAGKDALETVLQYHVLAAQVLSGSIPTRGVVAETLSGESLIAFKRCYWSWGWRYCNVYLQDGSPDLTLVTHPDNRASNGVVHAIDKVLIPPSLAATVEALRAPGH